ncbi:MAG: hypothetical protein HN580_15480 [Deltaproteobacteria bacterium]|nr:hypothetical protein [Deltaproteobacteria bacterium]
MEKRKLFSLFVRIQLSLALIVTFSIMSGKTVHSAEKTINIGFLGALSGPDAGWGLPGLTGNQIFIDRVNAEGGLLVGDKRYMLKMYKFDDEAIGSKAYRVPSNLSWSMT